MMLELFKEAELGDEGLHPPATKTLFWNVDFLLEERDVVLTHALVVRSRTRLEDDLAAYFAQEPGCEPLAKGLGAHDRQGETHIFNAQKPAGWWQHLPTRIQKYLLLPDVYFSRS
jgi:Uri superfamily endonuclease